MQAFYQIFIQNYFVIVNAYYWNQCSTSYF